jgi:inhibitor of cysteine peptidase
MPSYALLFKQAFRKTRSVVMRRLHDWQLARGAWGRVVGAALLLLLVSCGAGRDQAMSTVTLTQSENGATVEVPAGGTVVIRLEENPTTGFRWAIDSVDQQVLKLQSDDYSGSGGGAGAGGLRTFTLGTVAAGTTHIQLKLWREWEGDASITQRFAATIRVR